MNTHTHTYTHTYTQQVRIVIVLPSQTPTHNSSHVPQSHTPFTCLQWHHMLEGCTGTHWGRILMEWSGEDFVKYNQFLPITRHTYPPPHTPIHSNTHTNTHSNIPTHRTCSNILPTHSHAPNTHQSSGKRQ